MEFSSDSDVWFALINGFLGFQPFFPPVQVFLCCCRITLSSFLAGAGLGDGGGGAVAGDVGGGRGEFGKA